MINIRMSSALYVFPPTIITLKAKLQNHTLILYLNYKQNGLVSLHGILSLKLICTLQLFHLDMLQFTYIVSPGNEMIENSQTFLLRKKNLLFHPGDD